MNIEYKVMSREELTNYVLDFWLKWDIPEYEEDNDYLYCEIYNNLETLDGVEKELDSARCLFESGIEENTLEYENLDKLWNYLNWYKTDLQKKTAKTKINKYKNILKNLKKILNNEILDLLPFDIAEEIQNLFDEFNKIESEK